MDGKELKLEKKIGMTWILMEIESDMARFRKGQKKKKDCII